MLRTAWLVVAVLVIVYAVFVVSAREFLPVIHRYQPNINTYLSDKIGMEVDIENLSGLWQGTYPLVGADNFIIHSRESPGLAVAVHNVAVEIDLWRSLVNRSPVWGSLGVGSAEIHLVEDARGRWSLGGYPLGISDEGGGDLSTLFRMLYYSRLLKIEQIVLHAAFYSGSQATLFARNIRIENSAGFHRAVASLALEPEGEEIAKFIFEGRGDPADRANFIAQGYLELKRINVDGALNTIASAWFPKQLSQIGVVEMDLDLKFWFDWFDGALKNGRGHLRATEIPWQWSKGTGPLHNVSADIGGWFAPGDSWGFSLVQLMGEWGGDAIEPFNMQFRQRVGERWGELELRASRLNLDLLGDGLLQAELLNARGAEIWSTLNPKGTLRQIVLALNFNDPQPGFRLRANLDAVAVDSWHGAPAARGVSGSIDTGLTSGVVSIDTPTGLALHYPQAYDDYMPYGATRGRVSWRWLKDEARVLVTSDLIAIEGDEGRGTAVLHLDLPTKTDASEPEMFLMVGMENSHSRMLSRYLPNVLDDKLLDWLDSSIGDANIEEAGFIWRGSLRKTNGAGRSIQVYARVANGRLDYWPGWPALDNVAAVLAVDNGRMDAWIDSATLAGSQVAGGRATLRQQAEGPLLGVEASIDGDAGEALRVLQASPVGHLLGAAGALSVTGPSHIALDLAIPLSARKQSEAYRVAMSLKDVDLTLPGGDLQVTDIRGQLNFDLNTGLYGEKLRGRFLGAPLMAKVDTLEGETQIKLNGALNAKALSPWLGHFSQYLQGSARVKGLLHIPWASENGGPQLELSSSLQGLAIELPAPFGKAAEDVVASQVNAQFVDNAVEIQASLDNRAALALVFGNGKKPSGELRLLAAQAQRPTEPGLLITGALPHFDWKQWQLVLGGKGEALSSSLDLLSPRLDLVIDQLAVADFAIGKTHLQGVRRHGDSWRFRLEADILKGELRLPDSDQSVLGLHLDHLYLPAPKAEDGQAQALGDHRQQKNIAPADIPEMDLAIDKLFRGEERLGDIAFKTRKIDGGILVGDIRGSIKTVAIKPQLGAEDGDDDIPAELRWTVGAEGSQTTFSGTLATDNIEATLTAWDLPVAMNSKHTALYAELGWSGSPWEMSLLKLDGYLGIEFRDGRFNKVTGVATNTLFKLVGLINFDTWLRRLRFDFSDLFSGGVSFDRVTGGLLFRQGWVDFEDPVVAAMPSGKIRLMGSADLIYEQIDARLVATMPVGTNLPWVAALLGGLPAAAGVYLTGKIFEKQVDQLSSISYRVKGPLDDPEIEVDAIFSDPTDISIDR